MKKIASLLFVFILQYFAVNAQYANWTNYSSGSTVSASVVEGNVMWVGSIAGLLKMDMTTGTQIVYNKTNSMLPVNEVRSIAIDAAGNKWLGTAGGGLVKFDGTNWTIYNTSNSGCQSNYISSVTIAPNGNIWFICNNAFMFSTGIMKYDGTNWTYYNNSNSPLPVSTNYINTLNALTNGDLWIGLYDCIIKYDGTNWSIFNHANIGYYINEVKSIMRDATGNIWAGTGDKLLRYNGSSWTKYDSYNTGYYLSYITSVVEGTSGVIWVGTIYNGLFKYNGTTWTNFTTTNSAIPSNSMNTVCKDNAGNIWIGTWNEMGLAKFDGNTWSTYNVSGSNLQGNLIKDICLEANGTKWIIASGKIFKVSGSLWTTIAPPVLAPGNSVISIDVDGNGHLWAGTYNNGIYEFNGISWTQPAGQPVLYTGKIGIDNNNNKWISTNQGLEKYDGTSWTLYNTSNSALPSDFVNFVNIDASNNIWAGTSSGLAKYNGTNWTIYNPTSLGSPYSNVIASATAANGNIVIGTSGDFLSYNGTSWTVYNSTNSPLPNSAITSLKYDSVGVVWIGTRSNGLVRFDGTNWTVANILNSGIISDSITCMTLDSNGDKWLGTRCAGISVFSGSNFSGACSASFNLIPDSLTLHHYYAISYANGAPPLTYLWNWGDGTSSTGQYPSHTYSVAGFYNICLTITDNNGCSSNYCTSPYIQKSGNTIISVDVVSPLITGINQEEENAQLIIYPNPATENVNIEVSEGLKNSELKIFNIQGKLVKNLILNSSQTIIDINDLESGFYFIKVQGDNKSLTRKIIIE